MPADWSRYTSYPAYVFGFHGCDVSVGESILSAQVPHLKPSAVIETLHAARTTVSEAPYQTVRDVFPEGKEVYPNAGFKDKDHIQICVRDLSCIKGYFRPIPG